MKKTHLLTVALLFLSLLSFSQNKTPVRTNSSTQEEILTPLKPLDASPAVFSSAQELEAKKQGKINATRDLIRKNKNNAKLVVQYREQLWRFENAIVVEPKN
jgi:hypothetical protein